jgi:putative hemolysin
MTTAFQKRANANREAFREAAYRERNPNSYKRVTGLALGELVCAAHGGEARIPIRPKMGVCYACATEHGEPLR